MTAVAASETRCAYHHRSGNDSLADGALIAARVDVVLHAGGVEDVLLVAAELHHVVCLLERLHADQALVVGEGARDAGLEACLLYTSPSPRDATLSRMPSSA